MDFTAKRRMAKFDKLGFPSNNKEVPQDMLRDEDAK